MDRHWTWQGKGEAKGSSSMSLVNQAVGIPEGINALMSAFVPKSHVTVCVRSLRSSSLLYFRTMTGNLHIYIKT